VTAVMAAVDFDLPHGHDPRRLTGRRQRV
jgi:hypothetical protein